VAPPILDRTADRPIEISVIAPTFNEAPNVARFVERVGRSLSEIGWEIVFVDDNSPDGTFDLAAAIAHVDRRMRVLRRIGCQGLASACIEGILASPAPYVAVIDADLQHDETPLPEMLVLVRRGQADCVVGSRYLAAHDDWSWDRQRAEASRLATRVAQLLTNTTLTDPMSGYFSDERLLRRAAGGTPSCLWCRTLLELDSRSYSTSR
jgi:dolichol-phosphate mannosyltransferase